MTETECSYPAACRRHAHRDLLFTDTFPEYFCLQASCYVILAFSHAFNQLRIMETFSGSCSSSSSSKTWFTSSISSKFSSNGDRARSDSSTALSRLMTADFVRFRKGEPFMSLNPFVRVEHVLITGREFVFRRIFPFAWFSVTNAFLAPDSRSSWLSQSIGREKPPLETFPLNAVLTSADAFLNKSSEWLGGFCNGGKDVAEGILGSVWPPFCASKTSRKCSEGLLTRKLCAEFSRISQFAGGVNGGVRHLSDGLGSYFKVETLLDEADNKRSLLPKAFVISLSPSACSIAWVSKFKIVGGDILRRSGSKLFSEFCIGVSLIFNQ